MSDKLKKGDLVYVSGKTWVSIAEVIDFGSEDGEPFVLVEDGLHWSAYDVSIVRWATDEEKEKWKSKLRKKAFARYERLAKASKNVNW